MSNLTHSIMSRDFLNVKNLKNWRLHNADAFPTIGKKGLQGIEMIHNGSVTPFSHTLNPRFWGSKNTIMG